MRWVIADTGPINYLLLIGHVGILPALFERIVLPGAVRDELMHVGTPGVVRNWIVHPPLWVEVRETERCLPDDLLAALGLGEAAAIKLAMEVQADLLLMDDRRGVADALQRGLTVVGTLGLLARAARRQLLDLADAIDRLKGTNFRYRQETIDALLKNAGGGR